jgi:hypothetical protein
MAADTDRKELIMCYTHRIRRCNGNKSWALVCLREDGSEIGPIQTALSIDALLKFSGGYLPSPDDVVQIVYYSDESA